ncbi:hypothetical protein BX616_000633 [Lobosporangium transversale]|uniref:Yeast cell wall synthesis Kre9/Knh1-like N-terminal domain-containing protein n=1 Tax=Lobosporangium transversale TaxID=64571 RepID=A0A1Y2GGI7_9FUNG|nr:hypothetical protein BCR41DRAFT_357669 [Lobosporangium transversale]KAF9906761.1 hypothetical protein BX616_000633 [Lobosporangium transversale]ORZ10269.1 hypothetical protein BCR41DRAFT_357669 [Lobosporangium transversale]|eukprot:XP_021879176.1 hypothetical protein BCR41DRAFT_357669 [Lobosporangium transversale]
MFIKSAVAALALVAAVSAQTYNRTYFTNPVGEGISYPIGSKQVFSWQLPCVAPSSWVAKEPTKVPVQFLNANNADNAFFLKEITTIDCTKNSGNVEWNVPTDYPANGKYSLRIVVDTAAGPQNAYSGVFTITDPNTPPSNNNPPSNDKPADNNKPSSASTVAPAFAGAVAVAVAAAMF